MRIGIQSSQNLSRPTAHRVGQLRPATFEPCNGVAIQACRKRSWLSRLASVALVWVALSSGTASAANNLTILTEENPPLTYTQGGQLTGLGVEVVKEIQRRVGDHATIEVLPWARAYRMGLREPNVALFATMRTAERESQFKWVGPLTSVKTSFYAKRGAKVSIRKLEDAKAQPGILVVNGFYTQQVLQGAGFSNLVVAPAPENMARMFVAERSPLMATTNIHLPAILAVAGAQPEDVTPVFTLMGSQQFIAFSSDTPDEVVRVWQRALDNMKRDGSFEALYKKWLPGETPPGLRPMKPWTAITPTRP